MPVETVQHLRKMEQRPVLDVVLKTVIRNGS